MNKKISKPRMWWGTQYTDTDTTQTISKPRMWWGTDGLLSLFT